ncbi:MAG: S-layer homology domain-containing protein [Firmicutes bacterium]|nr:S-layer homology domain-containing protein [Bacillota bacterium]
MKKTLAYVLSIVLLVVFLMPNVIAADPTYSEFKTVIENFAATGSGTPRDVAIMAGGRYALVLLTNPSTAVAKVDLLSKEIVASNVISVSSAKGIEVDEEQNVFFVSSATSKDERDGNILMQSIYVFDIETLSQVGKVEYPTPINDGKDSELYNIYLKKLNGKTYVYAVHQGTGWHANYDYFKDDTLCRIDVTNYEEPQFDLDFGKDGYLYLENIVSGIGDSKFFDVYVLDNGNMIVAQNNGGSTENNLALIDETGNVLASEYVKSAKYIEVIGDYAIISLTGSTSITAVNVETLEPAEGILPTVLPKVKYAGAAYDAKNDILYVVTDSNNTLLATGDYTEEDKDEPALPSLKPNGKGIDGYFQYAYFYGYGHGDAGADDFIKREEASALLYRILKQQGQIEGFVATDNTYSDVTAAIWSFQAVEYMRQLGVFEASDFFHPTREISRQEVAKMIALSLGFGTDDENAVSFDDLTVDNPFYVYVKAMIDNGVYKGYPDGTVRPEDSMSRGEFVTTINRLIGRNDKEFNIEDVENIFPDLSSGHWAYDDIMLATNGFSDAVGEAGKYGIDPSKKLDRSAIDYNVVD